MNRHACDRLTLTLDWSRRTPAVTNIQCPAEEPGGWAYELRRAFLQLWADLGPLLAAGWLLDGELAQAVAWHTLTDGHGRLVRTGGTVRLWRPPPPVLNSAAAPTRAVGALPSNGRPS
jgi:hypothetical protein